MMKAQVNHLSTIGLLQIKRKKKKSTIGWKPQSTGLEDNLYSAQKQPIRSQAHFGGHVQDQDFGTVILFMKTPELLQPVSLTFN